MTTTGTVGGAVGEDVTVGVAVGGAGGEDVTVGAAVEGAGGEDVTVGVAVGGAGGEDVTVGVAVGDAGGEDVTVGVAVGGAVGEDVTVGAAVEGAVGEMTAVADAMMSMFPANIKVGEGVVASEDWVGDRGIRLAKRPQATITINAPTTHLTIRPKRPKQPDLEATRWVEVRFFTGIDLGDTF
ncbi:hypothetical protein [Caldilinea sp.]|uniref:hypothetical protein n=1 Tax=Caldilinea sp. TaxID=2293560 RepID=UPI0026026708|nr:hypothetical protein [Caldilinea sp.]